MRDFFAVSAVVLWLAGQGASAQTSVYQRALYPEEMPLRENAINNSQDRTEFELGVLSALPNTNREVIVYSERTENGLPFDKLYWVYVAILDVDGSSRRVLDRAEVTSDLRLFTEFPGNFMTLRALVSAFEARRATIVAVELKTTLHGTGSLTEGSHFLYSISAEGKLARVLTLDSTSASGRSGAEAGAKIATLEVGTSPAVSGDVVLTTRHAAWDAFDDPPRPKCGPVTKAYYRFTGSGYELVRAQDPSNQGFSPLPVLRIDLSCPD